MGHWSPLFSPPLLSPHLDVELALESGQLGVPDLLGEGDRHHHLGPLLLPHQRLHHTGQEAASLQHHLQAKHREGKGVSEG